MTVLDTGVSPSASPDRSKKKIKGLRNKEIKMRNAIVLYNLTLLF
jgi:hypothetical protein